MMINIKWLIDLMNSFGLRNSFLLPSPHPNQGARSE